MKDTLQAMQRRESILGMTLKRKQYLNFTLRVWRKGAICSPDKLRAGLHGSLTNTET